jgi:hypothetical protein
MSSAVFHGERASLEFIVSWLQNERVVAGMNANVCDVTTTFKRWFAHAKLSAQPPALLSTPLWTRLSA